MAAMQSGYGLQLKHETSIRLDISDSSMCCIFQIRLDLQAKENDTDDIIMTVWWLIYCFQSTCKVRTSYKNLYSKETIILFHIKYKLLQFTQKTVDVSHW